jgi:hypothetical protein
MVSRSVRDVGHSPSIILRNYAAARTRSHAGKAAREPWVRLNKCTETVIDRDESEIGRFLWSSSSKKGTDNHIEGSSSERYSRVVDAM